MQDSERTRTLLHPKRPTKPAYGSSLTGFAYSDCRLQRRRVADAPSNTDRIVSWLFFLPLGNSSKFVKP